MFPALTIIVCTAVVAQQEASTEQPKPENLQRQKWNELYILQASKYEIFFNNDREQLLQLKPEPVFFWTNPVRYGETNGAVFVWTRNGRAEAVGSIFSYLSRGDPSQRVIAHEFLSLAEKSLGATRDGRLPWSIRVPGISPRPVPDAPKPATTAAMRLPQMRELARDFTATAMHNDVERDLRLLPQPIFRNSSASGDVLDGALFTFVTGTDPELMLLIEARQTNEGPAWQWSAGRFSDLTLKLRHKQAEVWKYERTSAAKPPDSPYLSGWVETRSRVID
jgi:hypothetical protein